jgi:hypothetical protein
MDPADRLAGGAEEAPWWHGAADTPFGRFGDVRDPMGAVFNVIGRIG